jgi:hypothetical protein
VIRRVRALFLLLTSIAVASSIANPGGPARAASTTPFSLFAPVYAVNQAAAWPLVINTTGMKYLISVDLPNITNSATQAGMTSAVAAGKTVLGYLTASYAPRAGAPTVPQLGATINALFAAAPQLGGVFLDEVSSVDSATSCSNSAAYYQAVGTWMRANKPGKLLVLNPGTALCPEFQGSADAYLVFEDSITRYNTAFKPYYENAVFDWLRNLPDEKVWMLLYGADENSFTPVLDDMSNSAGVLWSVDTFSATDIPSGSYRTKLGYRATLSSPPTTTAVPTTTTATTSTTTPPTTTVNVAASTTAVATTTSTTSTTTSTVAPTTTTAAPALSGGGGLVGSAGPRGLVNPVLNIAPPVVFTPTPTTAVVPENQAAATTSLPATSTTLASEATTTVGSATPLAAPASSAPPTTATNKAAEASTTVTTSPKPVVLKASAPKKGAGKTRQLKVFMVGITAKKIVFLKNGKPIKSKPLQQMITITTSNLPVQYSVQVTTSTGQMLESLPIKIQPR